jgi:TPR repeat protein
VKNTFIFIFLIYLSYTQVIGDTKNPDNLILLNDEEYYKTGVEHYDNGDFKKSFIVFFNLSEKGNKDAIYNLSNMYFEGIGTIQDFKESIKYTWLCSLNGNKRCLKKIKLIKQKLEEEEFVKVSAEIPKLLENDFVDNNDPVSAFKLGYWYEKISPEIDLEKSYLWYSVSVSAGVYKAMKMRDRVGELIEKKKILEIQKEANDIFTKNKYFNSKKGLEE